MSCGTCLDQFDLLGIGGREDSYSDLLGHAFLCSASFRDLFLGDLLGLAPGPDEQGWQAIVRPGSGPIDLACCDGPPLGAERRQGVPDLVFHHRERGAIVAIVNKLFVTGEPDLTERFADIAHRDSLAEMLGLDMPSFHLYYLSLRGARPLSPAFRALSYQALLEKVLARLPLDQSEPLGALLLTLRDRLGEYYGRRPPAAAAPLKEHLRYRHRLVFSFRNFEVFAGDLFSGYQTDSDVTTNMECCYIPLYRAWHPNWVAYPELASDGAGCYSAHYELQWNTRLDKLTLYFHVESDPARAGKGPQCLLRDQGERTVARFQGWRGSLYERLLSHHGRLENAGWNLRRSFVALMSAQLAVTDTTSAGEVRERIANMLAVATPLVDTIVAEAAR